MPDLYAMILLPFAVGLLVLVTPERLRGVREGLSLGVTALTVYLAVRVRFVFGDVAMFLNWGRIGPLNFSIDIHADALSGMIAIAMAVMAFLIVLYSVGYMRGRPRLNEYYALLLWTLGASLTAALADNLLLLLAGWELGTVLLFLLVATGSTAAREAAGKTFVILGFADSAMLLGIVLLWVLTGALNISGLTGMSTTMPGMTAVYVLLFIGGAVKAGAMPGHTWIPPVAETAPVSVTAYLPASLDKLLGIYLLLRISLTMFSPTAGLRLAVMLVGAATIVLAVIMALVQHDLKKLLAFHAVSQVGYMVVGIGTGVPAGIAGGLFHMLNNAIYKSGLFLAAGAVEKRSGTTDLEQLGGLARIMPWTFGTMIVTSLAISGIPPLNGFTSKWLIYQGLADSGHALILVAAMFGSALTLASFVKVLFSVFLGGRSPAADRASRAGWVMTAPMVTLALLCVIFGVFAQLPLRYLIGPAVNTGFSGVPGAVALAGGLWSPTLATVLLLSALAAGVVIVLASHGLRVRTTRPFVGGEMLPAEESRYPGTGFYEGIRTMEPLKTMYRDAEAGIYDLYVLGGAYGGRIIGLFRSLHNGIISTYVAFVLIGMGFLLFALVW